MKNKIDITKLPVRQLRQRLFTKQSSVLYDNSEYTFNDNVPEAIEQLDGFIDWESFSHKWDILWVGLDPRKNEWVIGRHHSPLRQIIEPLRIIPLDERTKRMMLVPQDRENIKKLSLPNVQFEESDEDRIISNSLSGKVLIDETDEDKAIRLIQKNMELLQTQLNTLLKK